MKKIIYSLVIMIAAGSLFTSCIEPVEPVGLLELREAKAEYIKALKELRAADAALQLARAEVEKANAAYRNAEAAYKQAETDSLKEIAKLQAEYQRLVNEAKAIENDMLREDYKVKAQETLARIEAIQQQMENNQKQHEIDLVAYQQKLAEANENLRVALRNIALASQELTADEQTFLNTLVTAYETAFQNYTNQQHVVMAAQQAYDAAVAKLDSVDLVWDSEEHEYVEQVALWEKDIEKQKKAQEEYRAALENVPEQPQLEEWDEYLKKYSEDSIAWAMKRWQNTKDSAELMVTVHDAAAAYKSTIKSYLDNNGLEYTLADAAAAGMLKPTSYYGALAYTQITPEEPEYNGETSYWPLNIVRIPNEAGTGYDYYGPGLTPPDGKEMAGTDTVADLVSSFPKLKGRTSAAYDKFNAVIASYTSDKNFTYYDAEGTSHTQTATVVKNVGNNYSVTASLDMKDYLLATAETNIGGAKLIRQDPDGNDFEAVTPAADYGLKGAVDILKRWKVLVDKEGTAWEDSLKTVKKAWENDRDTLTLVFNYGVKKGSDGKTTWQKVKDTATPKKEAKALEADNTKLGFGLTVPANMSYLYTFPTYKNALDAIPEAKKAYDDAVADSVATMKTIKEKMQAYIDVYNNWDGTEFNGNDSSNIWGAMKEYILARAAALKMPDETSAKAWYTKNFGPKQNPLYYYYAGRSDVSPAQVDSILWTDLAALDWKDFRKQEDRGANGKDTKYAFYAKDGDPNDGKVPTYATKEDAVFVMIAYQLFNTDFYSALITKVALPDTSVATFTASGNRTLFGPTAFGGTLAPYTAVLDGATIVVKSTDDIKDRADLCLTTTPKATYKAKAQKVQAAINKYKEIYNNYWGFAAFPGESEKRDPQCYELKTFNEPYPIAVYTGDVPEPTSGLQVVLASVDPLADPADAQGTNFNPIVGTSQIFGTDKKSDFCKYMEATWKSANEESASLEQDIKDIEAWVTAVEEYFGTYAEHEAGIAKKVFDADYASYENQVAYGEFWYESYATLVGGETTNQYGEKVIRKPVVMEVTLGNPFASNFVNPKTGKWTIAGAQLETAQKFFGEDFAQKYGALYATEQEIADEIAHNNIILNAMKPAYVAAAKIAQYNHLTTYEGKDTTFYTGNDFYEMMANYQIARDNYVNQLNREIETAEGKIDKLMKKIADFTSGASAQELEIQEKLEALELATALLQKYADQLDMLDKALENLVAYLEGTGATFVLPEIDPTGLPTSHAAVVEGPDPDFAAEHGVGSITIKDLIEWIAGLFGGSVS